MAGDSDRNADELAQTATAVGSSDPLPQEALPLGETLGRYKIQKELGRGGMGVVHAAFDPDLERRIALKVLRGDAGEARQRLLREARAMARVTHSNVVTVHEVGTAAGRDFIAMELVDGETLEDWLAATPRTEREIVDAFLAAGRGLAAAHAAGLVHRDFKPRNVLVSKDGRIVVTDFGLVVGVESEADAFMVTQPTSTSATSNSTPSSLSGLTKTGSVLGTPAYMAPEQWTGGQIGPPADQFAFCVALWEALAKERPYKGTTLEALKDEVVTGKRAVDTKIPRRLREILRRGLDPDPAKRYPTMEALLAEIRRGERRGPGLMIVIGAAAIAAIAIVFVVLDARSPSAQRLTAGPASCRAPALEPSKVWVARDGQLIRDAHQGLAATSFERDFGAWTQARAKACSAPAAAQEAQLACLDGVLARFDSVKRATLAAKADDNREVGGDLIDPNICLVAHPPRLTRVDLYEVFVAMLSLSPTKRFDKAAQDALIARTAKEPCASAYAHLIAAGYQGSSPEGRQHFDEAERAEQTCGDDTIAVDIALYRASVSLETASPSVTQDLAKAEALIARVAQPDVIARLELYRAVNDMIQDEVDSAIEGTGHAADLYAQRGLVRQTVTTRMRQLDFREVRARPDDIAAIEPELRAYRSEIVAKVGSDDALVHTIDMRIADWMWRNGDVAGADALLEKSRIAVPARDPRDAKGRVVDEKGAPVAGATVYAGSSLVGDALHAAMPANYIATATTAADGSYTFHDLETGSICIAELGDRRSQPAHIGDDVTLKLMPTSRITGHVDLKGRPPQLVTVSAADPSLSLVSYGAASPVLADGTFSISGAPRGRVRLDVSLSRNGSGETVNAKDITVTGPLVENVQVAAPKGHDLFVLVRSMYGLDVMLSQVFVVPGKRPADTTVAALIPSIQNLAARAATPISEHKIPDDVRAASKPGDLYAKISDVPDGDASACTIPLPAHPDDPKIMAILNDPRTYEKIPVHCTPVKATDKIVVAPVPPWPRFD